MNEKHIKLIVKNNEEVILPIVWISPKDNLKHIKEIHLTAKLLGNNAALTIIGIFFATSENSIRFTTNVIHSGLNTKSLTTLRAVMKDKSEFNNDGMVQIMKGAKNTQGFFQSKILLFDDARGRSVPSLEIDENEVKAGHGSTIGRPDPEQLLYMQSRGIGEKEAETLIISGFFEPLLTLLSKIDQNNVRKKLHRHFSLDS